MSTTPQKRALKRYRKRLNQQGMARFEVLGLDADRELIRSLARRLAGDDPALRARRHGRHRRDETRQTVSIDARVQHVLHRRHEGSGVVVQCVAVFVFDLGDAWPEDGAEMCSGRLPETLHRPGQHHVFDLGAHLCSAAYEQLATLLEELGIERDDVSPVILYDIEANAPRT